MAQQVQVTTICDLSPDKEADRTGVLFGFEGVEYEIDLTEENYERLIGALEDFIDVARRVGGRKRAPGVMNGAVVTTSTEATIGKGSGKARLNGKPPTIDREQTQAMREWGSRNGYNPSPRGRLSRDLIEAFQQAHA